MRAPLPVSRAFWLLLLVSPCAVSLQAGPPPICQSLEIGDAQSLPAGSGPFGTSEKYDRTKVVDDTLALLTPKMPLIVRMETLRRATIYATAFGVSRRPDPGEPSLALALFERLLERQQAKPPHGYTPPELTGFDVGYYMECLRQTGLDVGDGYGFLTHAAGKLDSDPEMHFALALASAWPRRSENAAHVARARDGAARSTLIAANLPLLELHGDTREETEDPAQ